MLSLRVSFCISLIMNRSDFFFFKDEPSAFLFQEMWCFGPVFLCIFFLLFVRISLFWYWYFLSGRQENTFYTSRIASLVSSSFDEQKLLTTTQWLIHSFPLQVRVLGSPLFGETYLRTKRQYPILSSRLHSL